MSDAYSQCRKAITIPCPECQPVDQQGQIVFHPPHPVILYVCIRCERPVRINEIAWSAGIGIPHTITVDPPLSCGHRPEDLRPAILSCRCGGTGHVTVQVAVLESDKEA